MLTLGKFFFKEMKGSFCIENAELILHKVIKVRFDFGTNAIFTDNR